MRRHLVEQQDRCRAPPFGDKIGMGEHDAQQQRLLLAGRTQRRRLPLRDMGHQQVGAVRPDQRPPRRRIPPAPHRQRMGEGGRIDRLALQGQRGAREHAVGPLLQPLVERRHRRDARGIERRAMLDHPRFQRAQPVGIDRTVAGQQPVALAHRRVIAGRVHPVRRGQRQHQPVEEAPPLGGRLDEQPVHRRGQPQH